MQSEQKCAKCQDNFTHANIARIIPNCGHNICNNCVKSLIANHQSQFTCLDCNQLQLTDEDELDNFPKNITIIKQIRQSSLSASMASQKIEKKVNNSDDTDNNSSSMLINDSSKYSQMSDRSSASPQLCPKHGKPLEIICIEDHGLLCPHCAIFGEHRNHEFKTLFEMDEEIKGYQKALKQISGRKKNADLKIKGDNYKKEIVNQVTKKKDELMKQIRENFAKLSEYVRTAQNKVLDELVDSFRKIDLEINKMTKEENKLESTYEQWKRNTYDYISKIQHTHDLINKISLFYTKRRPSLVDGNNYVEEIEEKNKGISQNIKSMISSIHMEYSVSIEGYIYNYARVAFNALDLTEKTMEVRPKSKSKKKEEIKKRPLKMEFVKSDAFTNSSVNPSTISQKRSHLPRPPKSKSPDLHVVRSNPKIGSRDEMGSQIRSPKKAKTPNKNKKASEKTMQQNLQFAERMLNQFKHSTDTLDITGCELGDNEIVYLVNLAAAQKPIRCLKLSKNKLTTFGLKQIIPHLVAVTNINISSNMLNDESMDELIKNREILPHLRVVNVAYNKLNERRIKSKVEELKRMGVIVTL